MSITTSIIDCAMAMVMAPKPGRRIILTVATLILPTRFGHYERRDIDTCTISQARDTRAIEETVSREFLQVPIDPSPVK